MLHPCVKLKGRHQAVVSLSLPPKDNTRLASGGEDGSLIIHDIDTQTNIHSVHLPSLLSTSMIGPSHDNEHGDLAVSSIAWSNNQQLLWASCSRFASLIDLRASLDCVQTIASPDDIGTISLNDKDSHLALGDDSGNVSVIDLTKPDRLIKALKAMRPPHSSIVSGSSFRRFRPWDLVSSSLDHSVVRIFNPPMVHCMALSDRLSDSKGPFSSLAVCAVGDGSVSLFDLDAEEKGAGPKAKQKAKSRKESGPNLSKLASGVKVDLDLSIGGHCSPASAVTFLPPRFFSFDPSAMDDLPLIASGGEDRRILVWSLSRSLLFSRSKSEVTVEEDMPDDQKRYHPLVDFKHKRKINCLAHGADTGILFVADTGKSVTGFKLTSAAGPEIQTF